MELREKYDRPLPVQRPSSHGDKFIYIDYVNNEPFYVGMGNWSRVRNPDRNDYHADVKQPRSQGPMDSACSRTKPKHARCLPSPAYINSLLWTQRHWNSTLSPSKQRSRDRPANVSSPASPPASSA